MKIQIPFSVVFSFCTSIAPHCTYRKCEGEHLHVVLMESKQIIYITSIYMLYKSKKIFTCCRRVDGDASDHWAPARVQASPVYNRQNTTTKVYLLLSIWVHHRII